jgi:hypothetical protein
MSEFKVITGAFDDRRRAHDAVERLVAAGFGLDQIGFLTPEGDPIIDEATPPDAPTRATAGAAAGGAFGGLVGAALAAVPGIGPVLAAGTLASVLGGALVGAAGGGLLGGLIGAGIPEDEARHFEGQFHSGRTLVTVRAPAGRDQEAAAILRGAAEAQESVSAHPADRVRHTSDVSSKPGSGSVTQMPS